MGDRNGTAMTTQPILNYYQQIHDQALQKALKRNEEQFKIWTNYKTRHKQVVEGLEKIPLEVGINCMVPIGKKALMRGRLVHTNEILVSLGEGYLVKYSAAKAIDLCNRRIQLAEDMLTNLEIERNLYEMRQILPLQYDVFGDDERSDLIEHCSKEDLDQWRISHREKEREYRRKLSVFKSQQKPETENVDDLFHRLDQLELQEELADELDRLEEDYSQDDLADYSDEDSGSSEEIATETIHQALLKQKRICAAKDSNYDTNLSYQSQLVEKDAKQINERKNDLQKEQRVTRRVSFNESVSTTADIIKQEKKIDKVTVGSISNIDNTKQSNDDDEPILINIRHSEVNAVIRLCEHGDIDTPWDIYKSHFALKSILKKIPNENLYVKDVEALDSSSTEEENEIEGIKSSAYVMVVKDIQEKNHATEDQLTVNAQSMKRPMSKFKMERRSIKK